MHYLAKDKNNMRVSWQTFDRWWFKNCVNTTVNTIISTSAMRELVNQQNKSTYRFYIKQKEATNLNTSSVNTSSGAGTDSNTHLHLASRTDRNIL